ncbi:MAG: dipeptidyl-peptidase 3 family protein, partial [Gemmatimonadales bacterium]
MRLTLMSAAACLMAAAAAACGRADDAADSAAAPTIREELDRYTTVRLTADLDSLTDRQRRMIPVLIEAAEAMDQIYWHQAYGARDSLMDALTDADMRAYVELNYGPWDRLRNDEPFVPGVGPKPDGANFYPRDMTRAEFDSEAAGPDSATLRSLYTLVRRDSAGALVTVPYHEAYAARTAVAVAKLREAAALADNAALRRYLELRATALETDEYLQSDLAWMDMKDNVIEVVIGPIETYEDKLYGYKAAHEAYVLIKDQAWSRRLARYASLLPALQRGLPVPDEYKQETPGSGAELNAYDAVYYAGQANAGAKTIAINLPNDERVQLQKGTRRLQLKNTMRAKFDRILIPIADMLIAEDQREHVTFDAFFTNTMFHEVAHGLGIKNTITDKGTVRIALKEQYSAMEEGKADVLGLYMITALAGGGEFTERELKDSYVTFLASIFRSIRFGASDSHGRANLVRFNFFRDMGAFSRDSTTGRYRVDFDRTRQAMDALSERILRLQGEGDYEGTVAFMNEYAQQG